MTPDNHVAMVCDDLPVHRGVGCELRVSNSTVDTSGWVQGVQAIQLAIEKGVELVGSNSIC